MIELPMRWLPAPGLAAFLVATALPAWGTDAWIRLSTPDFELYTLGSEKTGREALLHFEQVKGFFLHASPVKKTSDVPVRIVEFGSDKQFKPYAVNEFSPAYYIAGPAQDYIVMSQASTLDFSIATHEYMHLIIRHSGLRIPIWLNEGWAEVYSTLRSAGKRGGRSDSGTDADPDEREVAELRRADRR